MSKLAWAILQKFESNADELLRSISPARQITPKVELWRKPVNKFQCREVADELIATNRHVNRSKGKHSQRQKHKSYKAHKAWSHTARLHIANKLATCICALNQASGFKPLGCDVTRNIRTVCGHRLFCSRFAATIMKAETRSRQFYKLRKIRDPKKLEISFRQLQPRDIKEYDVGISAFGRLREWGQALSLLKEVQTAGMTPTVVSFTAAISACGKRGKWQHALLLLDEMCKADVTPDSIIFNAAISASERSREWQSALSLVDDMHRAGVAPDMMTFNTAILACENGGQSERALSMFEEMCSAGMMINEFSLNVAISACKKRGHWDRILSVIDDMRSAGFMPGVQSLCAAISACKTGKEWQHELLLLEDARKEARQEGLRTEDDRATRLKPEELPELELDKRILYEDEDIAVINKPANCMIYPGRGSRNGTLVNGLLHYFQNNGVGLDWKDLETEWPGIVHRLDKDTTGCMVIAKHSLAHAILTHSFANREVHKEYLSVTSGKPERSHVNVDTLIAEESPTNRGHKKMRVMPLGAGTENGQIAKSIVYTLGWDDMFSLLRVEIHTGRTHQVRVHLQHLKTPIVGDEVYGLKDLNMIARRDYNISRVLLHAHRLSFPHPMQPDETVSVMAPLPDDFFAIAGHIIEGLPAEAIMG